MFNSRWSGRRGLPRVEVPNDKLRAPRVIGKAQLGSGVEAWGGGSLAQAEGGPRDRAEERRRERLVCDGNSAHFDFVGGHLL